MTAIKSGEEGPNTMRESGFRAHLNGASLADLVQMEQLYTRRRLAYAAAHVRIDAGTSVDEVVERLLEWIGYS